MKQRTKYQVKCRFKKGDEVIVMTGKSKGETGKIDHIDFKNGRVYVANTNIYKRHTRPSMANQEGGILDKQVPMDISNIMLVDPKKKTPTRIGYKIEGDRKVRFAKKSGAILS